jgi:hypothetical protein
MQEDTELMRLVKIEELGGGRDRREGVDDV